MPESEDDIEIAKWLSGELSDKEFEGLRSKEELDVYKRIIGEVDAWKVPTLEKEGGFSRLNGMLTKRQEHVARQVRFPGRWTALVAASFVILIVSTWLLLNPGNEIEIETAYGERREVVFPDKSIAILNGNTRIVYSKENWTNDPKVKLSRGEAYFHGNHQKGFLVAAGKFEVMVLGTRFNIANLDSALVVSCFSGEVVVSSDVMEGEEKLLVGNNLRINESGVRLKDLFDESEPLWIYGEATNFKNAPLREVFTALKNQFGIDIIYQEGIDQGMIYTGSFLHRDVELALRMVCDPLNLKFRKVEEMTYEISL